MGDPVTYFDIGCRDREKTAAFYRSAFGWRTEKTPLNTHVRTGGGKGIDGAITALGHEPHTYVMIYLEVDDADAAATRIAEAGGTITIGPMEIPDGGGRFAWFTDPEGNRLGIFEAPAAAGG